MKYVALLRGINVGGNSKVSMAELKKVFEGIGHANVSTYINSGNVIFESEEKDADVLVSKIETAIKKKFGFAVRVVIRDNANIQKLAKAIPAEWTNDADQRTDVLFLWSEFDKKETIKLIASNPDVDVFKYISGAIVWHFDREHYAKSGMHKFIGTQVYKHMTARNVNTVRKLAALMK